MQAESIKDLPETERKNSPNPFKNSSARMFFETYDIPQAWVTFFGASVSRVRWVSFFGIRSVGGSVVETVARFYQSVFEALVFDREIRVREVHAWESMRPQKRFRQNGVHDRAVFK